MDYLPYFCRQNDRPAARFLSRDEAPYSLLNVRRSNLLSRDWCNLVFEGRNKDYGAYRLRASAGRRYATAMAVVAGVVVLWVGTSLALGYYVRYQLRQEQVDVTAFSRLKRDKAQKGHELKQVAPGRALSHAVAMKPGATLSSPEIVRNMPPPRPIGHDGPVELSEAEARELALLEDIAVPTEQTDDSLAGPQLLPTEVVEQMPKFPGGLGELMKWLDRNVIYPQQSIRRRKEGRVEVSFVVDVDGTVRDAYISRKLDPTLDRACLMAIRRMPRWEPGRVDGRVARVLVTLPVDFCLE